MCNKVGGDFHPKNNEQFCYTHGIYGFHSESIYFACRYAKQGLSGCYITHIDGVDTGNLKVRVLEGRVNNVNIIQVDAEGNPTGKRGNIPPHVIYREIPFKVGLMAVGAQVHGASMVRMGTPGKLTLLTTKAVFAGHRSALWCICKSCSTTQCENVIAGVMHVCQHLHVLRWCAHAVQKGALFKGEDLQTCLRDVFGLGLFESMSVQQKTNPKDDTKMDIDLMVKERPGKTADLELEWQLAPTDNGRPGLVTLVPGSCHAFPQSDWH